MGMVPIRTTGPRAVLEDKHGQGRVPELDLSSVYGYSLSTIWVKVLAELA